MDPLTEKLLERARARRENLARKMAESNMSPRKTTATTATSRVPLRENQLHNLEPRGSPVKARSEELALKPDTPAIPSVKSRLHRLAEQRQDWNVSNTCGTEVDSPKNVLPPKRPDFEEEEVAPAPKAPVSRRSRFAALAANINSWEDDTNHPRHDFPKEKPATRKWQPPKRQEPVEEPTPVPAKRSAPTTFSQTSSAEISAPSTQPSPPKRTKYEEKESTLQREPSGKGKAQFKSIPYDWHSSTRSGQKTHSTSITKCPSKIVHGTSSQDTSSKLSSSSFKTVITVQSSKNSPIKRPKSPLSGRLFVAVGTRKQSSSSDESDSSSEQPVPAPRAAKTDGPAAESPVKTHVTTATPVKRPILQSCTPATPKIESPRKQASITVSPMKAVTKVASSPLKHNSPIKKSPVKQQAIRSSPVKQVNKARNTPLAKRGATSQKFAQARALLEQGCGGGGAASRQSPVKTTPRVGAMAQRIQERLKADQSNWQKNAINKKVQEERQKEMALIKARWEGQVGGSSGTKEEVKSTPVQEEEAIDTEEEEEMPQDVETEEEMDTESCADADVSESNAEDDYNTEEDEIIPTHTEGQTNQTGIVQITMERSAAPSNDRLDIIDDKIADESEVNISDVLGDIDELIVEAEQAMKEEEKAKAEKRRDVEEPTQATTSKADLSGWDYNIDNMEPIYANISEVTNSASSSSQDEGNPVPAPRTRRRSSSVGSVDSCISTASSLAPISLESYRSQQQQKTLSPTTVTHRTVTRETASRTVIREPSSASRPRSSSTSSAMSSAPSSRGNDRRHPQQQGRHQNDQKRLVAKKMSTKERIQRLMEEVSAQQSIIHQTSQALELIAATEEYHGTKEEIEAERLLVVTTQRRQACLSEIQYLKNPVTVPKTIMTEDGEEIVPCRGSVTIKDIRLPLKTQYLMALDSGRDQIHHSFFVIVRCQEHVIATQILSTREISGDCLHFTNLVCLNDLGSDFTIELLVYEMRGRCATLDAVQSKKAATMKHGWSLTPKKFKGASNFRQGGRYPQSPGPSGQSTVRQNSFAMVGSARLSLASCQLKKCTLTKVPFLSPLEGAIHLTMSCHTDSQTHAEGFLTMFDDCSGLGMWHRRWCVLHGGNLSFWKYPGDEKKKPPIGTIDLKSCITREVKLISRIHCARPNTFELQTSRPSSKADRDTLVSKNTNSYTVTKHLLSADTKEDRVEWTTSLNKTLLELRLWCKDAVRPSHE
ncbi:anillin-like isoform X1 [Lytechinus variegatus]|uniref:anillin-like isoform X1 n=1 Tax=Lytechinus variegatus TaxID=7654 RepID=UPI001BB2949A|nr:anillin-like isoform X1 [Lytechinus variegatus]